MGVPLQNHGRNGTYTGSCFPAQGTKGREQRGSDLVQNEGPRAHPIQRPVSQREP
jgi:hypothetical protein